MTPEPDEKEVLIDMIFGLFNQACRLETSDGYIYDHMCLSIYQEAQEFLIEMGRIKEEECVRP